MHAADSGFDKNDVSVLQYDLRSHAAPVHDAPSHDASIGCRQQVDASNVIGDANAPQFSVSWYMHAVSPTPIIFAREHRRGSIDLSGRCRRGSSG